MKSVCRRAGALVLSLALLMLANPAAAQVLKQVPKDAAFVLKINDLQALTGKMKDMAQKLGLTDLMTAAGASEQLLVNPIGLLKQQLQVKAGLKDDGEFALAIFAPAGNAPPNMVALVPVSDYAAFIANFQPAKEGAVDVLKTPLPVPVYAAKWGDYAALTNTKEMLAQERGMEVGAGAAKLMQDRDVSFFVNVKAVRPLILPQIQAARQMFNQVPPAGAGQDQAQMAAAMGMVKQMMGSVEKIIQEGDGAVIALGVLTDGLVLTQMAEFSPTGDIGKAIKEMKNTDADLLKGLPNGKYAAVGGWSMAGGAMGKLFEDFYFPMFKAIPLQGADAARLDKMLAAMKAQLVATNSYSMALLPPKPEDIAQSGLLRGFVVVGGDAKEIMGNQRKMMADYDVLQKAISMGMTQKASMKADAKTIDGVSLDETTLTFVFEQNNPMAQQQQDILKVFFGQKLGMTTNMGMVTDKSVVSTINTDDQQIQSLIAAVKQGASPAGNAGIKAASTGLPKERLAVGYIYAAQIAQVVGAMTNNKLPESLGTAAPIGMSIASDGGALRLDTQVPADLMKVIVDVVKQLNQPAAPAGGAGK